MAAHSSTPAWKIPWTEEPGRLQSMGSLRVRHNWATSLSLFTFMHWRRKWQPTPVFLPGESQGRGSLVGCRLWGRTESDWSDLAAAAVVCSDPLYFSSIGMNMADGRIGSCHSWDMTISPVNSATTPPQQYPGWGPNHLCTNWTLPFPEPTVCSLCVNASAFDVHHLPQPTYCCCSVSKSCPTCYSISKNNLGELQLPLWNLRSNHFVLITSPVSYFVPWVLQPWITLSGLTFTVLGFP